MANYCVCAHPWFAARSFPFQSFRVLKPVYANNHANANNYDNANENDNANDNNHANENDNANNADRSDIKQSSCPGSQHNLSQV